MLLGFLLVVLVLICIALGAVILLQKSEGGAFGVGGGPSGLLTARGAGDLLTRTTSVLAGAFFILCLLLTILSGHMRHGESVVDRLKVDALNPDALNKSMRPATAPVAPAPVSAGSGAPAKPTFEAPTPQVHTAPTAAGAAIAPATTTDSGARSSETRLLGYQSAPQVSPTVGPHAPAPPAAATKGNTAQ